MIDALNILQHFSPKGSSRCVEKVKNMKVPLCRRKWLFNTFHAADLRIIIIIIIIIIYIWIILDLGFLQIR